GGHRRRGAQQPGQDLVPGALLGHLAGGQDDDLVGDVQNAFLVRDDDDGAVGVLLLHPLKDLDQVLEAPQVDAGLRLVKDGQLLPAGQDGGDLDPLQFAARQAGVHLAVDVIFGAQAHLGQVGAGVGNAQGAVLAGGDPQQVQHLDALEPDRLLEGIADALVGPFGDAHMGDVLAVEEDAAGGRLLDAGDQLGKGGLAPAVGAGDGHEPPRRDGEGNIPDDLFLTLFILDVEGYMLEFQHGMTPR